MGTRVYLVEAAGRERRQAHMVRFSVPCESRGACALYLIGALYLVEAAGRERSHPILPLLGFGEPEGRAVCVFGRGPSNNEGRRGGGGGGG